MAHELEIVDGVAQMAYRVSKGLPWHQLGTPVGDDLTPIEIMKIAGLDWTVSKADTYAEYTKDDGTKTMVPTGRQALIRDRDGSVLTEVGKTWNPVQNEEAFDFFVDFVKQGDMVMDTAGSLKNGKIVWALADLKDEFELFGGDKVRGYLLFTNPHKFGQSIDIRFCAERVVCNNTLTMALGETGMASVKINHRRKFEAEKVKEILGLSHRKLEVLKEQAEFLGSKLYTSKEANVYFGAVFGKSDKANKDLSRTAEMAQEILETQPGNEYAPGSYWQLFNSVTYVTDHLLGRSVETRLESSTYGSNAKRKLDALNLSIQMARAA